MELDLESERTTLGAMVDSVHEVLELAPEKSKPRRRSGPDGVRNSSSGSENVMMSLSSYWDIDRVFSTDEIRMVHQTGNPEESLEPAEAVVQPSPHRE